MKIWHGRFRAPLDPEALTFSSSLPIDKRLYREDIDGSLAHVAMLAKCKIVTQREARRIRTALLQIRRDIESGGFQLEVKKAGQTRFVAEDVHMAIEARLIEKVGAIGGKLHTARSRNDQVALDERLFLRRAIADIAKQIKRLQKVLVAKSKRYERVMMPGYTHLQRAQPVLLAHHLLAYVSMLDRDRERFADCIKRVNRSPLGGSALAGTSFPIDRRFTAYALRFGDIIDNSMDAVSDRDVQLEFLAACSITMMHLSRLSEEVVLWNSREWHFVEIGDAFTTGSSIMPQKKNPDIAELVRGKTGRVYGDLVALLTIMKGLPLTYNRDMQEDKEPLFDAADTVRDCLSISASMMKTVRFNEDRFEEEMQSDALVATELADYLVRKGLPFRKAHATVGAIVQACVRKKIPLNKLPIVEYKRHSKLFSKDIYSILDPRSSLSNKRSAGSTSPKEVRKAIRRWRQTLG